MQARYSKLTMYLEIASPEALLFSGEVDLITVPDVKGEFEMLNDPFPIVTILKDGHVKLAGHILLEEEVVAKFAKSDNGFWLAINSGTIEMKDNKVIVLAD